MSRNSTKLQSAVLNFGGVAGVPGSGTTTVVAAPGVGFRLRIWGCGASHSDVTLSFPNVVLPWSDGAGLAVITQFLAGAANANSVADYFPGGIALGENQVFRNARRYSIANRPTDFWALYTIEPV